MSADRILLRGLRVLAFCGVLPEEVERRQPFEIDLDVMTDLGPAGQSDDLDDTINYGELTDRIAVLVDEGRFSLLEHFAQRIADLALAWDQTESVVVEVRKLRPPVAHALASSGVRIERSR